MNSLVTVSFVDLVRPHRLNACEPARAWITKQLAIPGMTLRRMWRRCRRPDWLLWVAARLGVDRRYVVAGANACAHWALQFVPAGEGRPARTVP